MTDFLINRLCLDFIGTEVVLAKWYNSETAEYYYEVDEVVKYEFLDSRITQGEFKIILSNISNFLGET